MEKKQLQLQPRLNLLAHLVPGGSRLADIGTDHGYLPVWLLQHGRIEFAIAADVGQEPLEHAKRTAEECGVAGIDFRLCDGLKGIGADEVDTIVIAGMGGETIIHILSQALWTAEEGKYTLLLQPMTKIGELRRWLGDHGYRFCDERLVWDKDFLYPVLTVTGGVQPKLTVLQQEYGVCLANDPLYADYLAREIQRLRRTIEGKRRADDPTVRQQAEELENICRELEKQQEGCSDDDCPRN